ncbi:MAG: hypothetical protein ABIU30_18550 [Ferruginibacter sp.]
MNLKDISVKKFIALDDIMKGNFYATETDREIALLVELTGNPEDYYLNMLWPEFMKHKQTLDFLTLDKVEAKAQRFIKTNGNVYAPVYDFHKLTAGQLIDVLHFAKDEQGVILNLPNILASFCVPTKKTFTGRKLLPYGSKVHAEVSQDMLTASIVDAYSISVFFWDVWNNFLAATGDYLVRTMLTKKAKTGEKLTQQETTALLTILEGYGDGITQRKK